MVSTPPDTAPRNAPSPTMLFVAFGGLMASLAAGYGVLFTIVDDYRDEYGISETAIGVVIGIGFVAAFLSQVLIAPFADRGHARTVVLFGVGINVVGLLLMGFSTTLTPILIGRFISGIGIGAAVPAARRIVILADPNHLGQNLGRLLAADVFGFALGPAVSAVLVGPFGIPAPFIVVAAATVIMLPFVARVAVDESTGTAHRRLAVDLLRIRPFAGAVVLGAAVFVMIGSFDAPWALVHSDLGTTKWVANLGITLFALPLIVLGPIGGRWAQVYGPFK
ncbi:MAG: MFS transporter, partial [Ilumatobacteraceae bacterium]